MFYLFRLKREFSKIAKAFKKRDIKLSQLKQEVKELEQKIILKDTLRLLVIDEIRTELKNNKQTTPRTPQTIPQTPRTNISKVRKKANIILNKAEIMQEIASLSLKGLSTGELHHEIVEVKQLCGKTCFYKYLKQLREETTRTTRTPQAN